MLALGIPGSATAAVMLGGLMIWGLHPGPMLFIEQKDFVWGLIASMYLGNVMSLVVVLSTVPLFASILRIPFSIIAPVIIVVCAIGAYTVHNSLFEVGQMVFFGLLGYVFKKLNYPIAPLVLAMVLGSRTEDAFRQSMLMSKGSLAIFWSNGLAATITTLALLIAASPLFSYAWRRLRRRAASGL
jgi:TctA family transporter